MRPALQHLDLPFAAGTAAPVTQPFGYNNPGLEPSCWDYHDQTWGFHYAAGADEGNWHLGVDFGVAGGTPLLAAAAATVYSAGPDNYGFGYLTILDHGGGLLTFYAHQSRIDVQAGQTVAAHEQIGLSGGGTGDPRRDGNSTGSHLHWACAEGDGQNYFLFFDPAPYLNYNPPQPPVTHPAPTAGRYKVRVAMFLRSQPQLTASHVGAVLPAGTVLTAHGGWTTNFREVTLPDGRSGWAFAPNLSAA